MESMLSEAASRTFVRATTGSVALSIRSGEEPIISLAVTIVGEPLSRCRDSAFRWVGPA